MEIETLIKTARACTTDAETLAIVDRIEEKYKTSGIKRMKFSFDTQILMEQMQMKFDTETNTYTFNENAHKELLQLGIVSLRETLGGVEAYIDAFTNDDQTALGTITESSK